MYARIGIPVNDNSPEMLTLRLVKHQLEQVIATNGRSAVTSDGYAVDAERRHQEALVRVRSQVSKACG